MVEHRGRKFGLMGLIEEEWLATLATLEREEQTPHQGDDLIAECAEQALASDFRLH